jgi:hypothetical protein
LGSFPKKQILTREQARFIIWCLTYDRIQQKASGSRYHSYRLLTRLAKTFGVTRECIVQIDRRRIWRSIIRPKPKQLFFAKKQDEPGMLPRDAIQRAQDFFHKQANEALEYYARLRTLLGQEMTKEESEELEGRMASTKREIRSLMAEMSNQAFKNLPYFYAKASLRREGDQQNPLDVVKQMFREIDDANRGRPTWMKQDLKLVSRKHCGPVNTN